MRPSHAIPIHVAGPSLGGVLGGDYYFCNVLCVSTTGAFCLFLCLCLYCVDHFGDVVEETISESSRDIGQW